MRAVQEKTILTPEVLMRLLRKCVFAFLIVPVIGCHDTSGPPPLPANYMLVSVNGRPLPTVTFPFPEAPTVLDGTLFLDGAGNAVIREHQHVMIAPGEVTYTTNYTYTISDSKVEFHSATPCPPDAICAAPPVGTFLENHLLVDMGAGGNALIYDYQLVMPD